MFKFAYYFAYNEYILYFFKIYNHIKYSRCIDQAYSATCCACRVESVRQVSAHERSVYQSRMRGLGIRAAVRREISIPPRAVQPRYA